MYFEQSAGLLNFSASPPGFVYKDDICREFCAANKHNASTRIAAELFDAATLGNLKYCLQRRHLLGVVCGKQAQYCYAQCR